MQVNLEKYADLRNKCIFLHQIPQVLQRYVSETWVTKQLLPDLLAVCAVTFSGEKDVRFGLLLIAHSNYPFNPSNPCSKKQICGLGNTQR